MKSLVIYFSRNGENYVNGEIKNIEIGNTEIIANYIKDIVGADLFKVEPINEYPYNYKECCDLAKLQLENNLRPKVKTFLDDINNYDVIYIGGPIWWGHYPCPLYTVLENLDFNGKIVKPFSTHEGSKLGSVMDDIKKICIGAEIKEGLAIQGSEVKNKEGKLESWCKND